MEERHSSIGGRSIALLGLGTAAAGAMGLYLYRKPRLRSRMRNADSIGEAATLLGKQVREDSANAAGAMMHTMSGGVTRRLRGARRFIGTRFVRGKQSARRKTAAAKTAARHAKNETKHLARSAKADARNATEHARLEAEHLKDELNEARDFAAQRTAGA